MRVRKSLVCCQLPVACCRWGLNVFLEDSVPKVPKPVTNPAYRCYCEWQRGCEAAGLFLVGKINSGNHGYHTDEMPQKELLTVDEAPHYGNNRNDVRH
jgi:hypothetical protein